MIFIIIGVTLLLSAILGIFIMNDNGIGRNTSDLDDMNKLFEDEN